MNDPAVVLDASVLVAGMRPGEVHHVAAREALEMLTRQHWRLFLPAIALAEVAAAIGRGTGSAARAERELTLLRQTPRLMIMAVDASLGERAAAIAGSHRIRGCDAVYVALAQMLNIPLITLDREQRERSPAALSVFAPDEVRARLFG
ncbi:MAG: PIN domain-containing protein [Chloroflexi bacterium]|nr:PIN domain-containing protein [Chloroflexota bacterium]